MQTLDMTKFNIEGGGLHQAEHYSGTTFKKVLYKIIY